MSESKDVRSTVPRGSMPEAIKRMFTTSREKAEEAKREATKNTEQPVQETTETTEPAVTEQPVPEQPVGTFGKVEEQ